MAQTISESIKKQLAKPQVWFCKYFPVRIKNVGEDAVAARQLVWDFKDAREEATERVARMTAEQIISQYGEDVSRMTFVCVPASSQAKNESRYKAFCHRVSELPASKTDILSSRFRVSGWRFTSTDMTRTSAR